MMRYNFGLLGSKVCIHCNLFQLKNNQIAIISAVRDTAHVISLSEGSPRTMIIIFLVILLF